MGHPAPGVRGGLEFEELVLEGPVTTASAGPVSWAAKVIMLVSLLMPNSLGSRGRVLPEAGVGGPEALVEAIEVEVV